MHPSTPFHEELCELGVHPGISRAGIVLAGVDGMAAGGNEREVVIDGRGDVTDETVVPPRAHRQPAVQQGLQCRDASLSVFERASRVRPTRSKEALASGENVGGGVDSLSGNGRNRHPHRPHASFLHRTSRFPRRVGGDDDPRLPCVFGEDTQTLAAGTSERRRPGPRTRVTSGPRGLPSGSAVIG